MKPKILLIILIIFVVLIIFLGIFNAFSQKQNSIIVTFPPPPTPIQINNHFRNIIYEQNHTAQMINTIQNRPSIPPSDSDIKTRIINSIGNDSGTVNKVDNEYRIDYVKSPDLFQVEILTTDFNKAKADAVAWLQSQGFSQEGICKLPVTFYINFDVKQQLPQGIVFNPLPDNC